MFITRSFIREEPFEKKTFQKIIIKQTGPKDVVSVILKNILKIFTTKTQNCNSIRSLKLYFDIKDEKSNQRKVNIENKERLLQKQNDRYIELTELLRSYVELEN